MCTQLGVQLRVVEVVRLGFQQLASPRLSPHSEFSVPSCPSGPALGEINRADSESWLLWGRNGW